MPETAPNSAMWVILPTYNEAENLEMAVGAVVLTLAEAAPAGPRVLIVDDASPDGTGALADGLADAHPGVVEVLHRPRLAAAAHDAELVLGSRYVPGGQVLGWGALRGALSRGGCWYAQAMLGLDVRDLPGGFKCFRREVLEAIDLPSVRSQGYGFQVELTYRAVQSGFDVREIPIVFRDRRASEGKMSWRIALEAVWRVPQIRVLDGR